MWAFRMRLITHYTALHICGFSYHEWVIGNNSDIPLFVFSLSLPVSVRFNELSFCLIFSIFVANVSLGKLWLLLETAAVIIAYCTITSLFLWKLLNNFSPTTSFPIFCKVLNLSWTRLNFKLMLLDREIQSDQACKGRTNEIAWLKWISTFYLFSHHWLQSHTALKSTKLVSKLTTKFSSLSLP